MAKIKKFKEITPEISPQTVETMLDTLSNLANDMDVARESFEDMKNRLIRFRSKSEKSNDQIDESYIMFQSLEDKSSEIIMGITEISEMLDSYLKNGRDFLF